MTWGRVSWKTAEHDPWHGSKYKSLPNSRYAIVVIIKVKKKKLKRKNRQNLMGIWAKPGSAQELLLAWCSGLFLERLVCVVGCVAAGIRN